jgi:hypothetical protein
MSAIKSFFEEERARKQRIQVRRVKQVILEEVYIVDQAKLDAAHATLMNWIVYYPEDLLYYYNTLDQEEYEYVLTKKSEFPLDVQHVLWGLPPCTRIATRVALKRFDIPTQVHMERTAMQNVRIDEGITKTVLNHELPERPPNSVDEMLADLRTSLVAREEELQQIMNAPTKKYVVPSMRQQTILADPAVQALKLYIETLKNEIVDYETYTTKLNNGWRELKQFELRCKVVKEMYTV